MSDNDYTPIEGVVEHITKKAVLMEINGDKHWIPFSVIFEDDLAELEVDECMEINVADWFVAKEGL